VSAVYCVYGRFVAGVVNKSERVPKSEVTMGKPVRVRCDQHANALCPDRRGLVNCPHSGVHDRSGKCKSTGQLAGRTCIAWGKTGEDGKEEMLKCLCVTNE